MGAPVKCTIIPALLINAIVVAGLSAMWQERVQGLPRAQTTQYSDQSRRKPVTSQERQRARLREKKDSINAYHRMSRYAGAPEPSVMEAATRPLVEPTMPMPDERVIARRAPALSDDEMMALERKRQSDLKLLSGMYPETVSGVKRAMRKRPDISILESPGRRYEYAVALEREAAKDKGQGQFAFEYDSPQMLKRYDALAYEKLEPNAPVIQSWAGRSGKPFHEQLLYTLPEYVTPEMAEAYEQMRPSTVYNSLPQRSWRDYWKEESGLASDIYATKRRAGEFVNRPIRGIKRGWQKFRNSPNWEYLMTPAQYKEYLSKMSEPEFRRYYRNLPENRREWIDNYLSMHPEHNNRWYNWPARVFDESVSRLRYLTGKDQ
jgi:hypothetical protein